MCGVRGKKRAELNSEDLKKNICTGEGILDGAHEVNKEMLVLNRKDGDIAVGLKAQEQAVSERLAEIVVVAFFFIKELLRFKLFIPAVYFGVIAVAGIIFRNYPGVSCCIRGSGNIGHTTGVQSQDRIQCNQQV